MCFCQCCSSGNGCCSNKNEIRSRLITVFQGLVWSKSMLTNCKNMAVSTSILCWAFCVCDMNVMKGSHNELFWCAWRVLKRKLYWQCKFSGWVKVSWWHYIGLAMWQVLVEREEVCRRLTAGFHRISHWPWPCPHLVTLHVHCLVTDSLWKGELCKGLRAEWQSVCWSWPCSHLVSWHVHCLVTDSLRRCERGELCRRHSAGWHHPAPWFLLPVAPNM